jgi:hypothetical protein
MGGKTMRTRLILIGMVLTLTAAVWVPQAVAASGLPKLITQEWSGIKPKEIGFSGDGGNIVTGIRWKSWTRTGAVGTGTSDIQNCVPNCAQGSQTPVSTKVTFSNPVNGHFTKVVEVRHGTTLVARYGRPAWPEGAS